MSPALAHTGAQPHVHGLAAGLWHPVSGLDHLLAMTAVGVWAGLVGGAARWAWPLSFLAAMALAAAASASGDAPAWTEAGVALSVAVLGVAVAWGVRAPVAVGACALRGSWRWLTARRMAPKRLRMRQGLPSV